MYMRDIKNPVMHKVENPVYQDYGEIIKQYKENLVVITNTVREGERRRFKGGIVRYYGNDKKKILDIWQEMGSRKNEAEYGECLYKTLFIDRGVHIHD